MSLNAKQKKKKCRNCGDMFSPSMTTQKVCSSSCAISVLSVQKKKKAASDRRKRKMAFNANDRRYQIDAAQKAFNAYIRSRDKNEPCMSCGRHHTGQYHAGHYRAAGTISALRFNQFNVNKQCSCCNNHKSGNAIEYRINLVRKFGIDVVERLESVNCSKRWDIEELVLITKYYRSIKKRLETCEGQ